MDAIFKKVEARIEAVFGDEKHSHLQLGQSCDDLHSEQHTANRYHSFAPPSTGHAKWYVDGCSYFWAVSEALERESPLVMIRTDPTDIFQGLERKSSSWTGG